MINIYRYKDNQYRKINKINVFFQKAFRKTILILPCQFNNSYIPSKSERNQPNLDVSNLMSND